MRVLFVQLLLVALGVALAWLSPERLGFLHGADASGALHTWLESFRLFVIPLCLLIIGLFARKTGLGFSLIWGVWLTLCAVRIGFVNQAWYADWQAGIVVSLSAVLALALVVFSAIRLTAKT